MQPSYLIVSVPRGQHLKLTWYVAWNHQSEQVPSRTESCTKTTIPAGTAPVNDPLALPMLLQQIAIVTCIRERDRKIV